MNELKITDKITLYNADCMEVMKQYPDKYFDLAVVDPPYGIGYDITQNKSAGTYRTQNGGTWKKYGATNWDNNIPNDEYFFELERVSKNKIIWGGNFYGLPKTKCWLIWNKIQRDNRADGELAWTSFNKPTKIFDYSRADAYINDCDMKIHPTQKPIKLYDWIFKNYAKPDFKILDTHGGSMSSVISADKAGLEMVCCELDKEYFDKAVDRFKKYKAQYKLAI